jgi:hypothetical protein
MLYVESERSYEVKFQFVLTEKSYEVKIHML